jgi:hypothetical protein
MLICSHLIYIFFFKEHFQKSWKILFATKISFYVSGPRLSYCCRIRVASTSDFELVRVLFILFLRQKKRPLPTKSLCIFKESPNKRITHPRSRFIKIYPLGSHIRPKTIQENAKCIIEKGRAKSIKVKKLSESFG